MRGKSQEKHFQGKRRERKHSEHTSKLGKDTQRERRQQRLDDTADDTYLVDRDFTPWPSITSDAPSDFGLSASDLFGEYGYGD